MVMHIRFLPTFLFITIAAADVVHIGNPACDDIREHVQCLPRKLARAPGIGFYLAAEYGTVSISFHNGTTIDVARVEAHPDFTSLMDILALEGNCVRPTARTPLDRLYRRLENSRRERNKSLGQPASYASSLFAHMFAALRHEASIALNARITHALVTLPPLPGLQSDDLLDAASHVGITLLHGFSHGSRTAPRADISTLLTAAYAGVGLGLCEKYTDAAACRAEEAELDADAADSQRDLGVLRISLDERTLGIDAERCASAAACVGGKDGKDLHDMGFLSEIHKWNPDRYWTTVQKHITDAGERLGARGVDALILHGESVREPEFLVKLVEALPGLPGGSTIADKLKSGVEENRWDRDPMFLPSRGAAALAKRVQAGQRLYDDQKACMRARPKLAFDGIRAQRPSSW
ncbi:hypothetical protein Dda_6536 [Drechslerella dactyloides]|uniref:Uncharacterized protein n=1 Tax=Drechslerella dactyloides TaxID=74499 RepID=A0AAD6ITR5_DREDA|nr:hypothetical protein Dda_6536 [Drechslerella dactyloides]